jgi:hypothetical protein
MCCASRITHHASRITLMLGLLIGPAGAQDVFLGGGLDFEAATGPHTTFDFGRWAGVNFTYALEDQAEVYFEYNLAGGKGRTAAFAASFPRLRQQHVDLFLGRVALPFGLPGVDPTRRYVPGAPDWWDTFREYRTGNVFADHFGEGLRAAYQGHRWQVEAAVINAPDVSAKDAALRITAEDAHGRWRGGASAFSGEIEGSHYLAWFGPHLSVALSPTTEARVEALWGHAAAMEQRAYYAELSQQWKASGRDGTTFASWAAFDPDAGAQVSTLHLGVQQRLQPFGQVELRYEIRDAPGEAGEDRAVLRYTAIF